METMDDAGVYRISNECALVQTVDFLFPIVNDPEMNGMIAAANSLSDVWAMGGKAVTAMNILAYPPGLIPPDAVEAMLRGGSRKLVEAGVSLVGGHTMEQENVLYGMSVTGTIHPDKILTNHQARIGDAAILTKPLGSGIYSQLLSKDLLEPHLYTEAAHSMSRLNKYAVEIILQHQPSAMTDITGFGLLGHSRAVAQSFGGTLIYDSAKIPFFSRAEECVKKHGTRGTIRVKNYIQPNTHVSDTVSREKYELCVEGQTSGGILAFIPEDQAEKCLRRIHEAGDETARIIGHAAARRDDGSYIHLV
jgi:selenide,water dikinase